MSDYQNKYVSDILLKRPHETFVDDPGSLSEVNVAELVFDLEHNIKDINNLHLFHAVTILRQVVEDLIQLGADPPKLEAFRRRQLQTHSIDLDQLERQERSRLQDPDKDPGKAGDAEEADAAEEAAENGQAQAKDVTENSGTNIAGNEIGDSCPTYSGGVRMQAGALATSLEKTSQTLQSHNERLRKEVVFHMQPQVQNQAVHLVRNFSLAKEPPISIEEFLVRIYTYSPSISVSVYIHSAYMLYKLCVELGVVTLTRLNVHRFLLASLRCSTKKLEDVYQKQKSFATVGGLALRDLCRIEVSFLYLFNFQVVVSEALLNEFLASSFVALHAAVATAD